MPRMRELAHKVGVLEMERSCRGSAMFFFLLRVRNSDAIVKLF